MVQYGLEAMILLAGTTGMGGGGRVSEIGFGGPQEALEEAGLPCTK